MRAVALSLIVVAGACGPAGPSFDIADSDGIPVVRNYTPEWKSGSGWTVASRPNLSIEQWTHSSTDDQYHLADAKHLADGPLAVANGYSGEIALFGRRGDMLDRFGGEGLEPGKFQRLVSIEQRGGEIWAFDGMGRWNVFDRSGAVQSTMYLEPHGGSWGNIETYGDEMAVLADRFSGHYGEGRILGEASVLRYDLGGAALDTLAIVPGFERDIVATGNGHSIFFTPFGASPVLHGGRDNLYYGSADEMLIEVYSNDRTAERLISIPDYDLTVSDEEWAAEMAVLIEREETRADDSDTPALSRHLEKRETRPAYARFLEDTVGNLWVGDFDPEYGRRWMTPSERWTVFDPAGRWLGAVETPRGLIVTEIGDDFVLGIARIDERAVVQRYALEK